MTVASCLLVHRTFQIQVSTTHSHNSRLHRHHFSHETQVPQPQRLSRKQPWECIFLVRYFQVLQIQRPPPLSYKPGSRLLYLTFRPAHGYLSSLRASRPLGLRLYEQVGRSYYGTWRRNGWESNLPTPPRHRRACCWWSWLLFALVGRLGVRVRSHFHGGGDRQDHSLWICSASWRLLAQRLEHHGLCHRRRGVRSVSWLASWLWPFKALALALELETRALLRGTWFPLTLSTNFVHSDIHA